VCNHCGCREFAPIGELHAEHEAILERAWAIAEAVRIGDAPSPADYQALATLLDLHIAKEETGLYPVLLDARGVSAVVVEELEQEHRELQARLAGHSFDRRDYYELAAHIEAEEEELFPMTPFGFDDDDWETLDRAQRAAEVLVGVVRADVPADDQDRAADGQGRLLPGDG
jgi:iron-sulfur cluster repair protein YtfE (RIC family)